MTLKEKIPTVIDIYNKINQSKNVTDNTIPQIEKRPQSLNFSDAQRVLYPQDMRQQGKIGT